MRIPMMAGNWKMNKGLAEATALAEAVVEEVGGVEDVEIVLCPAFIALDAVRRAIEGSRVALGAQNMYWKESGAYTGEVSPTMLKSVGCLYVIIGHSERRGRFGVPEPEMTEELHKLFGDTDESVNIKAKVALEHGLLPIICVGEMLDEREGGDTDAIVRDQVVAALDGRSAPEVASLVMAYEPVWAIGTGETCDAREANRVIGMIRSVIAEQYDEATATKTRILYGGSVKPENVEAIMRQPEIDGGLVGGASLKADSFCALVRTTVSVYQ